jgi:hypothetical protein
MMGMSNPEALFDKMWEELYDDVFSEVMKRKQFLPAVEEETLREIRYKEPVEIQAEARRMVLTNPMLGDVMLNTMRRLDNEEDQLSVFVGFTVFYRALEAQVEKLSHKNHGTVA